MREGVVPRRRRPRSALAIAVVVALGLGSRKFAADPALVLRHLCGGYALGVGGLPWHRPAPAVALDPRRGDSRAVVLLGHRAQPALPCPLDRRRPRDYARGAGPGFRLPLERPRLLHGGCGTRCYARRVALRWPIDPRLPPGQFIAVIRTRVKMRLEQRYPALRATGGGCHGFRLRNPWHPRSFSTDCWSGPGILATVSSSELVAKVVGCPRNAGRASSGSKTLRGERTHGLSSGPVAPWGFGDPFGVASWLAHWTNNPRPFGAQDPFAADGVLPRRGEFLVDLDDGFGFVPIQSIRIGVAM